MNLAILTLAQAGGGGGAAPPGACGGGLSSLVVMLMMFAVFYFILIRPQQKRAKEHQQMLANLTKGDQVVTRGGLIGRITGIQDNVLTIELQEKVRVRVLRSHVDGKYVEPATGKEAATTKVEPAPTQPSK